MSGGAKMTHARSLSLPVIHEPGHIDLNTRSLARSVASATSVAGWVSAASARVVERDWLSSETRGFDSDCDMMAHHVSSR